MPATDAQLLEQFSAEQESAAFAELVRRHGPMVLGVCQRVLGDVHDAEDAFQAVFLVLARRAGGIRKREALASWLYGVAARVAVHLKARGGLRRQRERRAALMPGSDRARFDPISAVVWQELRPVLDEELSQLPEKYRAPLVLCYLQGKTNEEAARELGWPKGSMSRRLDKARELLRQRLAKRGITLSSGLLFGVLIGQAGAAVPPALADATVKVAGLFALGGSAAGVVSGPIAALAEGVLSTMFATKMKLAAFVLFSVCLLGGLGVLGGGMALLHAQPGPANGLPADGGNAPTGTGAGAPAPGGWVLDRSLSMGSDSGLPGAAVGMYSLAVSPTGMVFVTGNSDQTLAIWDLESGKVKIRINVGQAGGKDRVISVRFSPDGKSIVSAGEDKRIRLWDAASGKEIARMEHNDPVLSVAFSPDGKRLAAASTDRAVVLWDAATGKPVRELEVEPIATALAFSPDGKVLAVGGKDPVVYAVDAATGKMLRKLDGHTGTVAGVAFTPDGRRLVIGSDRTLRIWDVETGKLVARMEGHEGVVLSIAVSPDGRWIASAGVDRTIHIWEVATGKEIAVLKTNQGVVFFVGFTPDAKRLITGSTDGTVRVWTTQPPGRYVAPDPDKADRLDQLVRVEVGPHQRLTQGPDKADRLDQLVRELVKANRPDEQVVEALYLATLSRLPTAGERKFALDHVAKQKDRQVGFDNLLFALTNSKEFSSNVDALKRRDPRQR